VKTVSWKFGVNGKYMFMFLASTLILTGASVWEEASRNWDSVSTYMSHSWWTV